jgi:predicted GH43/DUF377 family glycosyl hydrolase
MINNFSKMVIGSNGSITNLLVPSSKTGGLAQTNPSIFFDGNNLLINIRYVEYALYHSEFGQKYQNQWGVLTYLHPEDDLNLRTKNAFSYNLENQQYDFIDTSKHDVEPLWEFVGLEDARIVIWDNRTFLCGVRRDTTTNGVGRMELSEIIDGKEINRYRIEPPSGYTYCEKNWMPVVDLPFHFVKWTNPTEVIKVNLETLSSETVILKEQPILKGLNRDLRGGSQVISYKDHYLAITHEVNLWNNQKSNKDGQYYHRFILWDKQWNVVKVSEDFKFLGANIEFCCGLTQKEDELLMTFGFHDSSSFLLKAKTDFIDSFLDGNTKDVKIEDGSLKEVFHIFACDPNNDTYNFSVGVYFYEQGHFASALPYFLRSAELSVNDNLIYEALILVSKCLASLGRRKESETTAILNAISFNPRRHEAYFHLAQLYEYQKDYFNCYAMSNIALSNYNEDNFLDYLPKIEKYKIKFQLGFASWWVGRFDDSRRIMFELANDYNGNYDPVYKTMIQNNITRLGSGDEFVNYTKNNYDNYQFKFSDLEKIDKNYSQSYQDMFILSILKGKKNGTYLEIGSADPFYGNNTYLLESQFGWEGQAIEILSHEVEKYNKSRKNKAMLKNALEVDYDDLLGEMSNYYQNDNCFDYLQVDCEPPIISFEILKKIPWDKYKFAVVTFEHDYYADLEKTIRDDSRAFMRKNGYVLVAGNVSMNNFCPYEDWWVHPSLVDKDILNKMKRDKDTILPIKKYMLNII